MASGLFARHGLDVELLDPAPGPENVRSVAAGEADVCVTSVLHYLTALDRFGALPARFIAAVYQRSPMAAVVRATAAAREPADLAGLRVGGLPGDRFTAEYRAALAAAGSGDPVIVPLPYEAVPAALGRGEVDVVPDFADLVPRIRRQAGLAVRAVPIGPDVYGSGVVAADSLSDALAARVRDAVAAALEQQHDHPDVGLDALLQRYPGIDPDDVREGWQLAAASIFTGAAPAAMDAARWHDTLRHYTTTHDLARPDPETVYRPAFCRQAAPATASHDPRGATE